MNMEHIDRDDYVRLNSLTSHLKKPDLFAYWFDFMLTVFTAWSSFFVAVTSPTLSPLQCAATCVASIGFYKGVNFVHEISHHPRDLDQFSIAYNIFFGFYTRVLSYFGNSHSDHHSVRKFGTKLDPEYENWSKRHPANVFRPALASFVSPLLVFIRISILPIVYVVAGRSVLEKVVRRYSSIVMNFSYEYGKTDNQTLMLVKSLDLAVMVSTWVVLFLLFYFGCATETLLIHYATLVGANMLGSFRALAVHRYISDFKQQPAQNQFFDSVSISNTFLSSLWGPLNSNFHSIHHLLPHLPYHSMQEAHVLLMQDSRWRTHYQKTLEKSLFSSLHKLFCRARESLRLRESRVGHGLV